MEVCTVAAGDWTTQDNMCRVAARRQCGRWGGHSHSCPIVQKAWAASAEWWRGSPVARLLGHNPRHHHRHNTQQRGEKGAAKSKKWFEFSMKRSPLCWRLFTPDIATPPPPPPHRRAAGVWTFLLGWRRETRFEKLTLLLLLSLLHFTGMRYLTAKKDFKSESH